MFFFFCMPFPLLGMRCVVLCDLVCVDALKSERLSKVVVKSCGSPKSEITTFEMFSLGEYLTMFKFQLYLDAFIFLYEYKLAWVGPEYGRTVGQVVIVYERQPDTRQGLLILVPSVAKMRRLQDIRHQ